MRSLLLADEKWTAHGQQQLHETPDPIQLSLMEVDRHPKEEDAMEELFAILSLSPGPLGKAVNQAASKEDKFVDPCSMNR